MTCKPKHNPWPDCFDEPHEYWLMIVHCPVTKERDKRKQLQSVGLDFDIEPLEVKA